jgi:hypothetical protein
MQRSGSRSRKTYPSRIDRWFLLLMAVTTVSLAVSLGFSAASGNWLKTLQGAVIALAVIGLLVWILRGTHYTLEGRHLTIRSGPFTWRVAIHEIDSIEQAKGAAHLRSSPALSMDRLLITYSGGRRVMISPADKERFLADLRDRQRRLA